MSLSKSNPLNGRAAAVALLVVLTVLLGVGSIPAAHAATSSVVQTDEATVACSTSTCSVPVAFGSPVTSGDVIVVGYAYGLPLTSLGDSLGTTLSVANFTAGAISALIGYGTLASSGTDTVTAKFSNPGAAVGGVAVFTLYIFEVSGVTTSGAVVADGDGFSSTPSTTASTSSTAFESGAFLLGVVGGTTPPLDFSSSSSSWTTESSGGFSAATYATSGVSSPTTFPVKASSPIGASIGWTEEGLVLNPIPTVTTTTTSTYTTTQTVIVTATSTGTVTSTQTSTTVIATGSCGTTTTTTSGPNHEPRPRGEDPTQTVTSTATTTVT
ncbi:MAG: hypothetical protein ABSF83_13490, partial [Nitrososphaerales archaeon]